MFLRTLKMRISHAIKTFMFYSGFFACTRKLKPNPKVAILRYHAIVDEHENFYANPSICLSKKEFEAHVKYFSKRYNVLSLDTVVDALQEKKTLPPNSVVFTFDDGYADNYFAAQILKKYGATGTFYLTAACIDRIEPFWLSEVIYFILKTKKQRFALHIDENEKIHFDLAGSLKNQKTSTDFHCERFSTKQSPAQSTKSEQEIASLRSARNDEKGGFGYSQKNDSRERWRAVEKLVGVIKSNNLVVRENLRRQLRDKLDDVRFEEVEEKIMLSWQQVREMCDAGMAIGGHTMTHLNLPNADPGDAKEEVSLCKIFLEEKLQRNIMHFSYPNSGPYRYYTDAIRNLVEQSGYRSSTTSFAGFAGAESDRFALKRVRTVPSLVETVAVIELDRLFEL